MDCSHRSPSLSPIHLLGNNHFHGHNLIPDFGAEQDMRAHKPSLFFHLYDIPSPIIY
jgi:hypothetical protein